MASITSLTNSNSTNSTSSLYGNRNVISGLASGMDTESMIQNAVSGYNTKITNLQQKVTKTEWKQEAYRSLISKGASFTSKYTSYTSSTNLLSSAFFNNAMKISTLGANADKIAATGKSSSDVQVLGVSQMATAASYTVSGLMGSSTGSIQAGGALDLGAEIQNSTLAGGSLSIQVGGEGSAKTLKLSFDSTVYASKDELLADINKKLEEANGKAGTSVKLNADGSFSDNGNNTIKITAASEGVQDALGLSKAEDTGDFGNSLAVDESKLVSTPTALENLKDKKLTFTLDGKAKTVDMNKVLESAKDADGNVTKDSLVSALNTEVGKQLGIGKVDISLKDGKLSMNVQSGSTLKVSGDAMKSLGFDSTGETSYANTGKTLEQLGLTAGDDGKYRMTLNDVEFTFEKDATVDDVISEINKSSAGVNVSFSQITNQFKFTAKETGAAGRVEFGSGPNDIGSQLFGGGIAAAGQDAKLTVAVNGKAVEMTRSSNNVEIDGMKLNLKETFNETVDVADAQAKLNAGKSVDGAVSFKSETDSDKIINAVKSMVEDYNTMVTELKKAFSTLPQQQSNGKPYEPLTEEDKSKMSQSTIDSYEQKAKDGLLFMDKDLSGYYNRLVNNLSGIVSDLKSIGISSEFSDGITTLRVDEDAMRTALETNPDKVRDTLAGTKSGGAAKDGLMKRLSDTMETYTKTTGTKGILVEKAGSTLSPSTLYTNTIQKEIDKLNDQISKWQDKLSDKVDYYTSKFTQLETLINNMNSQSGALAGLMGG